MHMACRGSVSSTASHFRSGNDALRIASCLHNCDRGPILSFGDALECACKPHLINDCKRSFSFHLCAANSRFLLHRPGIGISLMRVMSPYRALSTSSLTTSCLDSNCTKSSHQVYILPSFSAWLARRNITAWENGLYERLHAFSSAGKTGSLG